MSTYELQGDFQTEVLDASVEQPVLVDFWAAWCGPCRVLGPTLESLAASADGKWKLVKVDTEAHPQLGAEYQIQSIPAVKLFVDGRVAGEFVGALPEDQICLFLDQHLPTAGSSFLGAAELALSAGQVEQAKSLLERAIAEDDRSVAAKLKLAELLLLEDRQRAALLIDELHSNELMESGTADEDKAAQLSILLRLAEAANSERLESAIVGGGEDHDPALVQRYVDGGKALVAGDFSQAFERWIEVLEEDRELDHDGARRACVALFEWLGPEHPITQEYRRRFSSALF